MGRKILSFVTLLVFLFFTFSCTLHRVSQEPVQTISETENKNFDIVGVLLKNGGKIEFSAEEPARVDNGLIKGQPIEADKSLKLEEHLVILKSDIANAKRTKVGGDIIEITTKKGEKHIPVKGTFKEYSNSVECIIYKPVALPVSQVDLVWLRKVDVVKTFFASAAYGAGLLLILALIGMAGSGGPLGGGSFFGLGIF